MTADMLAMPRSPQFDRKKRSGINLEKWGWMYMRISGVLLVVLIFGHLFVNLVMSSEHGDGVHQITFAFVAGKLTDPFWQVWDTLMLWLALIHGANGMRTITNDYVTNNTVRRVLVTAIWLSAAVLIVLGTLVVFTFDPCLGVTPDSTLWNACQAA